MKLTCSVIFAYLLNSSCLNIKYWNFATSIILFNTEMLICLTKCKFGWQTWTFEWPVCLLLLTDQPKVLFGKRPMADCYFVFELHNYLLMYFYSPFCSDFHTITFTLFYTFLAITFAWTGITLANICSDYIIIWVIWNRINPIFLCDGYTIITSTGIILIFLCYAYIITFCITITITFTCNNQSSRTRKFYYRDTRWFNRRRSGLLKQLKYNMFCSYIPGLLLTHLFKYLYCICKPFEASHFDWTLTFKAWPFCRGSDWNLETS